ncbi:MAG TPA: aldo/keto reductase, partial [Clostridiales bacterium]|nr:aldo/keto reductase [Clostridiales bacterium]
MNKMTYAQIPYVGVPVSRLVHGTIMLSMQKKEASFALLDA